MKQQNTGPSLTDRMKNYENVQSTSLMRRTPVIIRLDGKAFRTWTTSLNRPFDPLLPQFMEEVVNYLMKEIQGCVFAFSQSDEISLFIRDYDTLVTEGWFGFNKQKMVSVASSLVTAKFNQVAAKHGLPLAIFDARVFSLPKEEVVNYFIYRQHDGVRNSVSMHANSVFGHKAIHGKSVQEMKVMLKDADKAWDDVPAMFRHGIAIRKDEAVVRELPLFKDNRAYIEELVYVKPE